MSNLVFKYGGLYGFKASSAESIRPFKKLYVLDLMLRQNNKHTSVGKNTQYIQHNVLFDEYNVLVVQIAHFA